MTYKEQIKHPSWQKKRLEVMRDNDFACQTCGSADKQLNVHHTYYANCLIWEYPNKSLQCLCCDCHAIAHGKQPSAVPKRFPDMSMQIYEGRDYMEVMSPAEHMARLDNFYALMARLVSDEEEGEQ